jgi:hypothetical protein
MTLGSDTATDEIHFENLVEPHQLPWDARLNTSKAVGLDPVPSLQSRADTYTQIFKMHCSLLREFVNTIYRCNLAS